MPPNQIAIPSATAMVLAEMSIAPYSHCASGDERPQAPNLRHPRCSQRGARFCRSRHILRAPKGTPPERIRCSL
ncbi:hypothetical protein M419DRAFT_123947 [Trichoderma reesei RUT C-30]|uniref:Uncharacterized protein n=1 Tax=Hypocrea jecorina (strain ATCC 56765 / BCRC 32924 / NRRL 11460 / Rut C-30) TaxID=1344414 RepID=A0A024S5X4_HYPJR|nr:hypothetical protein M419DRAFT_123947 [Trichoderma reesei RUT C-30]